MRQSSSTRPQAPETAKPLPVSRDTSARWESEELRAAAAQYCAERIPPPASMACPEGTGWSRRCAVLFAPELDIFPGRLADILREYKPPSPGHAGGAAAASRARRAKAELAALLTDESWMLPGAERLELASMLREGRPLTRAQRLAVARLLRGSAGADNADFVRDIVWWLCPNPDIPAWRVHRQHVTLRIPCRVEVLPAAVPLDTPHHTLKRQHVRLTEENTGRVLVFLHASACPATSRARDRRAFTVRSLYPDGWRADYTTINRNLKLLDTFISTPLPGDAWAEALREARAVPDRPSRRGTAG